MLKLKGINKSYTTGDFTQQALKDINQERNVLKMDPHERRFNNSITPETFEIDFDDFEDYINYNDAPQQMNYAPTTDVLCTPEKEYINIPFYF